MLVDDNRAPRFRAYLEATNRILLMERTDWDRLVQSDAQFVLIDIRVTPLRGLAENAVIVGTFAERKMGGLSTLEIWRQDLKDAPLLYNKDTYDVWENIYPYIDYEKIVKSADTDDDPGLRDFLNDYVFIVPKERDAEHHSSELPERCRAILMQTDASYR